MIPGGPERGRTPPGDGCHLHEPLARAGRELDLPRPKIPGHGPGLGRRQNNFALDGDNKNVLLETQGPEWGRTPPGDGCHLLEPLARAGRELDLPQPKIPGHGPGLGRRQNNFALDGDFTKVLFN